MASSSVEAPNEGTSTCVCAPTSQETLAVEKKQAADAFLGNASTGCVSSGVDTFASTGDGLGMLGSTACTADSHSSEMNNLPTLVLPLTNLVRSRAPPVAVKLFVGRLPLTVTEYMLCNLFSQFGPIADLLLIRDRQTNAFKGCAFVRMQSITDADRAIRHLDSVYVLDPALGGLQVKYAVGEVERLGLPGTSGSGAAAGVDQVKLFVGSLPPDVKEDTLRNLFERFGRVEEVFLMRDEQPLNGTNLSVGGARPGKKGRTGCAFVRFAYKEEALFAISELNGKFIVPGSQRAMEVRFAENRRSSSSAQATASASRSTNASSGFLPFVDCSRSGSAVMGVDECPEIVRTSTRFFPSQAGIERLARMGQVDVLGCLGRRHDCFSSTFESLAIAATSAFSDHHRPGGGSSGDPEGSANCDVITGKLRSTLERGDNRWHSKYESIEDLFDTFDHLSLNAPGMEGDSEARHRNPQVKEDQGEGLSARKLTPSTVAPERQGQNRKLEQEQEANGTHVNAAGPDQGVWNANGSRDVQPPITKEAEDVTAGCSSGSGGRTRAPSALDGGDDEVDIASLTAKLRQELAEFCSEETPSSNASPPTGKDVTRAAPAPLSHGFSSGSVSKVSSVPLSRIAGSAATHEEDPLQYGAVSGGALPLAFPSAPSIYVNFHERTSGNLVHPGGGILTPSAFPADVCSCGDFRGQVTNCAAEVRRNTEKENGGHRFPPEAITWAAGQLPSLYGNADVEPTSRESLRTQRGGEDRIQDGLSRFLNGLRTPSGTLPQRSFGSQVHGPPGANVFIFHIPNEWSEHDLLTHFSVYGPVLSARIASDRLSGRNRGFGFVSFANGQAAASAVTAMNGFQVNGKRLKVQIKKGEEQYAHNLHSATPYNNGNGSTWSSMSSSCSETPSVSGISGGNMPVLAVSGAPERAHQGDNIRPRLSALDWLKSTKTPATVSSAVPPLNYENHGGNDNSTGSLCDVAVALRNRSVTSQGHPLRRWYAQDEAAAAAMLVDTMRQPGTGWNKEAFCLAPLTRGEDVDSTGESATASFLGLYCTPTKGGSSGAMHLSPATAEMAGSLLGVCNDRQAVAIPQVPLYAVETKEAGSGQAVPGGSVVGHKADIGDSTQRYLDPTAFDLVAASSRDAS